MSALSIRTMFAAALALLASAAPASCLDDAAIEAMVAAWQSREAVRGLPTDLTMRDALCIRDRFVEKLAPANGGIAGYKAGLTNAAVQQKFGHANPVRGALFKKFLLPHNAEVPARFGSRPVIEADLLVEVGDASINEARTHLDVLKALRYVIPFIELADLGIPEGEPITAARIAAINVGARGGVLGDRIPVRVPEFSGILRDMRVLMTDEAQQELSNSPGSAILGDPLDAVLWLIEDLRGEGIRLAPGDLLSLGSFSPLVVPRPGARYTVRYQGLPGEPAVSVRFR